jgi:hypothetical protein
MPGKAVDSAQLICCVDGIAAVLLTLVARHHDPLLTMVPTTGHSA